MCVLLILNVCSSNGKTFLYGLNEKKCNKENQHLFHAVFYLTFFIDTKRR